MTVGQKAFALVAPGEGPAPTRREARSQPRRETTPMRNQSSRSAVGQRLSLDIFSEKEPGWPQDPGRYGQAHETQKRSRDPTGQEGADGGAGQSSSCWPEETWRPAWPLLAALTAPAQRLQQSWARSKVSLQDSGTNGHRSFVHGPKPPSRQGQGLGHVQGGRAGCAGTVLGHTARRGGRSPSPRAARCVTPFL